MSTPVAARTKSEMRDEVSHTRRRVPKRTFKVPPGRPGVEFLDKSMETKSWKNEGLISNRIKQSEVGAKFEMEPVRRGLISAFVAFMVVSFVFFFALSETVQGLFFTLLAMLAILAYFAISISSGDALGSKRNKT